MEEEMEFTAVSGDAVADCRVEKITTESGTRYTVVILYPHQHNGMPMSKVYEHELIRTAQPAGYSFSDHLAIHPKVKELEQQISAAIVKWEQKK